MTVCFFASLPGAGPCDGRLVKCHLIPRQLLKRKGGNPKDPRSFVLGCGGPMGLSGHHGRLDTRGCNPLRIPRHRLPAGVEELAQELALVWWLDREYGPVES